MLRAWGSAPSEKKEKKADWTRGASPVEKQRVFAPLVLQTWQEAQRLSRVYPRSRKLAMCYLGCVRAHVYYGFVRKVCESGTIFVRTGMGTFGREGVGCVVGRKQMAARCALLCLLPKSLMSRTCVVLTLHSQTQPHLKAHKRLPNTTPSVRTTFGLFAARLRACRFKLFVV